jgi:glycosyltransferase involved in cell wall biosynthesis
MAISIVINTFNESKNLARCLQSLSFADEIIVIDGGSSDETINIAKTFNCSIFTFPSRGFVEPARNFGIHKAQYEWIFIIDADEEVPTDLKKALLKYSDQSEIDYFRIPRKNIIFNKWIKHGNWWPDYQIRFFRKNYVIWKEEIHSIPLTTGKGQDMPAQEEMAIVHHNYASIQEFLERLNRYTTIQALESKASAFLWTDLLNQSCQEFLRRFFLAEGYKDGLHGLALALLQAFSELIVVLKRWEMHKFESVSENKLKQAFPVEVKRRTIEFGYWMEKTEMTKKTIFKRLIHLFS